MERTKKSKGTQNDRNRKQANVEFLRTIDARFHFNQLIFANNIFILATTFNTIANYHDNTLNLMISGIIAKRDSNKKEFFIKNKSKNTFQSIKILV